MSHVLYNVSSTKQMEMDYFNLQDIGRILIKGVKDRGEIKEHVALLNAYELGEKIS